VPKCLCPMSVSVSVSVSDVCVRVDLDSRTAPAGALQAERWGLVLAGRPGGQAGRARQVQCSAVQAVQCSAVQCRQAPPPLGAGSLRAGLQVLGRQEAVTWAGALRPRHALGTGGRSAVQCSPCRQCSSVQCRVQCRVQCCAVRAGSAEVSGSAVQCSAVASAPF
jgi:hypothetical protein